MKGSITSRCAVTLLGLVLIVAPLRGQAFPTISNRMYTDGSAKVVVTGVLTADTDIPINKGASFSSGTHTWLQFGAAGGAETNALITYQSDMKEIGISVMRGKMTLIGGITPGEPSQCSGTVEVTPTLVSGHYTCRGMTSYDPATGKMGKADVDIRFTAKS
jgi:hypothetical protein